MCTIEHMHIWKASRESSFYVQKYDNLKRDKAGIYGKDAAQAHARLRCARAVEASLPETRARLRTLAESLEIRAALVKVTSCTTEGTQWATSIYPSL